MKLLSDISLFGCLAIMAVLCGLGWLVERVIELGCLAVQGWKEIRKLSVWLLMSPMTMSATAGEVRLAWDASATTNVTNYLILAHTNNSVGMRTNSVRVNAGTNTTALVEGMKDGTTWYFVCVAQAGGLTSENSNMVIAQTPLPPASMRTVAVQYGATLTNFSDVGFFRLRIPAP